MIVVTRCNSCHTRHHAPECPVPCPTDINCCFKPFSTYDWPCSLCFKLNLPQPGGKSFQLFILFLPHSIFQGKSRWFRRARTVVTTITASSTAIGSLSTLPPGYSFVTPPVNYGTQTIHIFSTPIPGLLFVIVWSHTRFIFTIAHLIAPSTQTLPSIPILCMEFLIPRVVEGFNSVQMHAELQYIFTFCIFPSIYMSFFLGPSEL